MPDILDLQLIKDAIDTNVPLILQRVDTLTQTVKQAITTVDQELSRTNAAIEGIGQTFAVLAKAASKLISSIQVDISIGGEGDK